MSRQVLLIHGWSATSSSMKATARLLDDSEFEAVDLFLGDYRSTDDDIRISDVARRLDEVVSQRQDEGSLNETFHVVIHSTGALVVRHWLANLTDQGRPSPVINFLMLAPANFGSPLAHIGRGVLGRMKVGLFNGLQSGTEMLHGLELGSQFQEDLALRDRLTKDPASTRTALGEDRTRPFVIVGGLQVTGTQILNETGWDGTVRVAGGQLDPKGLTIDFSNRDTPTITQWKRRGPEETAFAFLPDRDHSSILKPDGGDAQAGPYRDRLGELILEALRVDSAAGYRNVVARWRDEVTQKTRWLASRDADELRAEVFGPRRARRIPTERFHEHYQVVVDAKDTRGHRVEEFGIWLNAPNPDKPPRNSRTMRDDEIEAHQHVLQDVHVNRRSPWRRVLHLDRYKLMGPDGYFGRRKYEATLMASISAPPVGKNINYGLDEHEAYGSLPLRPSQSSSDLVEDDVRRFLRRHTTHFVEVILPRDVEERAFTLKQFKR